MQLRQKSCTLKYHRVMTAIEQNIKRGKYGLGEKLPALRTLADEFDINLLTARKAVQVLAGKGIVELRRGSGTFVTFKQSKTLKLGLAFRKRYVEIHKDHPMLGAALVGAHQECDASCVRVQTYFYRDGHFVEDVGLPLLSEDINAVFAIGGGFGSEDCEFLKKNGIFLATYPSQITNEWALPVSLNMSQGLKQLIQHFRREGDSRIGLICWSAMGDNGVLHREFMSNAYELQMKDAEKLLIKVENSKGYMQLEDVENLFAVQPLPSAVIVCDEFLIDSLLLYCDKHKVRIPDDIRVGALVDLLPFNHKIPVTVTFGPQEITRAIELACKELIKRCTTFEIANSAMNIEPNLVIKASSGLSRNSVKT
jgi:DNA-binding transcriptional regulator YhcF (GntR family)